MAFPTWRTMDVYETYKSCLIASCAIRHHLEVLHDDRDYDTLARVSTLQVRRVK
jgi:hypothetical protein